MVVAVVAAHWAETMSAAENAATKASTNKAITIFFMIHLLVQYITGIKLFL